MSFAAAVAAVAAVVGAGVAYQSGQEQKKAASNALEQQKSQQAAAEKQAKNQLKMAEQDTNKANAKRPDTLAILDSAQQAGKAGASGTMLTGPTGVDPNALQLGKSTLLGS
jgi:polyphosphate kinase 2 (PPK2 family)